MNWVFWQMGSAPMLVVVGHFFTYAPEKFEYPINRFTMETKRQLDVLNRELATKTYIAGGVHHCRYCDLAVVRRIGSGPPLRRLSAIPRCGLLRTRHALGKADRRTACRATGRMVNRSWGEPSEQLLERHASELYDPDTGQAGTSRRRIRPRTMQNLRTNWPEVSETFICGISKLPLAGKGVTLEQVALGQHHKDCKFDQTEPLPIRAR